MMLCTGMMLGAARGDSLQIEVVLDLSIVRWRFSRELIDHIKERERDRAHVNLLFRL